MSYISGMLAAVPLAKKAAYLEYAQRAWPLFERHGALDMVENWGDEVPEGALTSFPMAVKLEPGESVVMSWITWPDKATSDACMASMQSDPAWEAMGEMPFDGKRMIFGGFETVLRCVGGQKEW
ncbi:DUF1428 domain-containing protein [uncultured Lentibacter sp.]|uniref:DUF1428 domain-containing protein n=1 Tax=uncultured Lentibacter sp. TaxID=1659309 RepID=UPI00262ADEA9|nr:DUF1428 domain-containing protein [uncultured Lentibacter sp.]